MILQTLCTQNNIPIESFWENDDPLEGDKLGILKQLIVEINWRKNRKVDLLKRIRRIGRKTTFSVRETRFLGKLIHNQVEEGYRDFEVILQYFPGKTLEMVKDHYLKNFAK